ncbi:aldolase/citrate lyase family protein [Cohnella rhizosphaerae]|uniref:Aldolase/citrate lyase family protein n=1 Tax=Cohnella rhizosphaerae TaxID=1457232 RepID=A0A9X4KTJ5_9BACL|nr:aldolase/citrate lyase family protein [Cohnella rhizosphaerae]MDG0810513.1 aldolase/citrate lyase family protein [Cohnella rhizosphaerae]
MRARCSARFRCPIWPCCSKAADWTFFIVDTEHGGFDHAALSGLIMTARLAGITVLVRLADHSRRDITRLMDMGADGVLLPMTGGKEDIAAVVRHAKYAPVGRRGISTTRGHTLYAPPALRDYMQQANERTLVFAQIESKAGLDAIDEIVGLDGVDGVIVGPNDLACDLDCLGGGGADSGRDRRRCGSGASPRQGRRHHHLGAGFSAACQGARHGHFLHRQRASYAEAGMPGYHPTSRGAATMNRIRLVHRDHLSCEPILRRCPNGELICVGQVGDITEPAPGNRVVVFHSKDNGETWSEPFPIYPEDGRAVYATELMLLDGVLYAFLTLHNGHFVNWRCTTMQSRDNGYTWEDIGIHPALPNFSFARGMIRLSNGDIVIPYQYYPISPEENDRLAQSGLKIWEARISHVENGVLISKDNGRTYTRHEGPRTPIKGGGAAQMELA